MKKHLMLFALALLATWTAAAQESTPTSRPKIDPGTEAQPLLSELHAARHIFRDVDGRLYIVEAGQGGDVAMESPFGTALIGATGQVTMVGDDGEAVPFITGLFSSLTETGEVTGPHAFYKDDTSAWVLVGQGVPGSPAETPAWALLQYSADGKTLENTIDLLTYEQTVNPDGSDIDSNPVDFVVDRDGTVYVADAGANAVFRIVDGDISTFAVWKPVEGEPQAVPTALQLGAEGNLYVGFLTGFPFPTGAAWIEVLDSTGQPIKRYDGMSMIVDIELDALGNLYAVEFSQFRDEGPIPGSGRIVRVSDSGIEPVVTGLVFPYGFVKLNEDEFLVANGSSFTSASELLRVETDTVLTPGGTGEVPDAPHARATAEATSEGQ